LAERRSNITHGPNVRNGFNVAQVFRPEAFDFSDPACITSRWSFKLTVPSATAGFRAAPTTPAPQTSHSQQTQITQRIMDPLAFLAFTDRI